MLPFLGGSFGNPSSSHSLGQTAKAAVEHAREQVASLLGAAPDEIIFTSGGTESNNLSLFGVMTTGAVENRRHLVITAFEHPAITEPAAELQRMGFAVSYIPCTSSGTVDPDRVAETLRDDTALCSVMHANNEIGTLQPIRDIASVCRERGVVCHTDACQSVGKVPVDVATLGVDLLSIAGHKVYAPKGIGALYIRRGTRLNRILFGAGQEQGIRPGTENVCFSVGLGAAAELAASELATNGPRMAALRDLLHAQLSERLSQELTIHGGSVDRLPNTLSVHIPGVVGNELLEQVPTICASTGAACHSGSTTPSATLAAIGVSDTVARGTLRLSVGRTTTEAEVQEAAERLSAAWQKLAR